MKASSKTEFHELTADERAAWMAALKPVHEEVAGRVGKDLIEAIYKSTGTQ
jgi:C4-dicarboxylate-binding protein DctP